MSFTSKPLPHERCSCGAEMFATASSLDGQEKQRASFREAHSDCRQLPEWQRCPICGGSGRCWDQLQPTRTVTCHGCRGTGMVVRPDLATFETRIRGTSS